MEETPQHKKIESLGYTEVIQFESTPSTHHHLLIQAKKTFKISPVFCYAKEQTQGVGQLGKQWESPKNAGVYCSALLPSNTYLPAKLSITVAKILIRQLKKIGITPLKIKHPNDIYYQERKLAGILCEGNNKYWVISIGLNYMLPSKISQHDSHWSYCHQINPSITLAQLLYCCAKVAITSSKQP